MTLFRSTLVLSLFVAVCCASTPGYSADGAGSVAPLMRLLDSGRLPAERVAGVVEMICTRGGPSDLAAMLERAVNGKFDSALQLRVLELLTDAAVVRKVKPEGDLSGIAALVSGADTDAKVRNAAIRLAAIWKVPAVADALQKLATDDSATDALRNAAVDGLASIGDASSSATLKSIATSAKSPRLRFRAAAALAKFDVDSAAAAAASALASATADDDVGPLVDAFLIRKGGPDKLAAALGNVTLTPDGAKLVLRYMYSVGRSDASLSDVLSKAAGIALDQKPPTPEELKQLLDEVASKGDAERGEKIFRRADLSCMKCHSIARAGGQVGPELTALGSISPVDYVANSILVPNLAIKEQFVTRVFITDDGQTITGIVVDRDDQRVNLRDASGKLVTIPTADIDEEEEGKSLMPQGLTKFLTRDELIDLIKFVSELGRPGPYAIRSTPTIQRWRVLRSAAPELQGEAPNVEIFREFVLDLPPESWLPAYGKTQGDLPLAEVGKPGEVVFLQGEVKVVESGDVTIEIAGAKPSGFWYDAEPFDPSQPIKINMAKGDQRLTLRVGIDEDPQATLKVTLTKPAGSKAQFDVVGGQ